MLYDRKEVESVCDIVAIIIAFVVLVAAIPLLIPLSDDDINSGRK